MKCLAIIAGVLLASSSAHAANIYHTNSNVDGDYNITIEGEIVRDDASRFFTVVAHAEPSKRIVVVLKSAGGSVTEGLQIADAIHDHGFVTWVPQDTECGSICAIIWLSGTTRFGTDGSLIGFHAAFDAKTKEEVGQPNALVGARLAKWGFSDAAIKYFMTAPPDMALFLTEESAKKYGIMYEGKLPPEAFIQILLQLIIKKGGGQTQTADNQQQDQPPPPPAPTPQVYNVRFTDNLNVRASPDSNQWNILDYIPQGTIMRYIKDDFGECRLMPNGDVWCPVKGKIDGRMGWVCAYYMMLDNGVRVQCLWNGARGCQ